MRNEKEKSIDWSRLQKALAFESENGFADMMGKSYRFSEFMQMSLRDRPHALTEDEKRRWELVATAYAQYGNMPTEQRKSLVEYTRQLLLALERSYNKRTREESASVSQTNGSSTQLAAKANPPTSPNQRTIAHHENARSQPLLKLPNIGVKKGEQLAKLGLYTVGDLLYYFPRDHLDYAKQVAIQDLQAGETVSIIAKVQRCKCFSSPKNRKLTILQITLQDSTGKITITRFFAGMRYANRAWQEQQKRFYPVGSTVAASGLVKKNKYGLTLDNPEIEVMDGLGGQLESDKIGRLVPVYPLTEGVGADLVRKAMVTALPAAANISDPLPKGLRSRYGLMDLPSAIAGIHFPNDRQQLQDARHRLVFDEFFYLQLGLLCRRQSQKQTQTKAIATSEQGQLIEQFYQLLPFEMTGAQKRVINEILTDIQKTTPMNRLVQGDVGSGKTVVAVVAMLAAIQSGYQSALMAPTEVLAEQHYQKLVNWLTLLNLPVELLTGSTKAAKRKPIYQQLATGELPVVVGTHALIQDTVEFHRLGLVAIDEQHRFGVEQRAKLQQKGVAGAPHVLTMTATPIPRTLALTLHGDLYVSQIDELPPGRTPVQTTVLKAKERKQAHDLIRREVVQGRQAYVVLPLVEESEKLDLRSAIEEYQKLQETVFPEFSVGLLHGRMAAAEKEEAIANFRDGQTQILVSTTVIEVGVDVPNATVMLVENAERFGLSQLHQLRGRVGRGAASSYCLLVMNAKATPEAQERLQVLAKSQDGFFIAEMDMRLRGPGEVMGTRQSGMPDFVLASLVEDQDVLMVAREAAEKVLAKDPTLNRWPQLKAALAERYRKLMGGAIWT